jgi:hypothetical protein
MAERVVVKRLGLVAAALFIACWAVVALDAFGVVSMALRRPLGFYPVYGTALFLGSAAGNLFSYIGRHLETAARWRLLAAYVALPPGAILLVRCLSPLAEREASPLVAPLAIAIYGVFFLVPLWVRRP